MLKASAIWINRLVWAMVVAVLIVAAAYVSIGRYYIGYVEQYQQQLVARMADLTDLPLTVGRLYGRWSKLAPILTLENLQVYAAGPEQQPVLTINNIRFKIDPIRTVLKRAIQVQHLYIDGVKCSLLETEPGRWQLKGYPTNYRGGGDADKLMDLLLSVRGAELLNAELGLEYAHGSKALLAVQELSLKRGGSFRRLRVQANFGDSEQPLTAVAEARGDPRQQASFSARAYLKLDDIDFSAQLPALNVFGVDVKEARADGEVWLDWRPGTLIGVQGRLAAPVLDIADIGGEPLQPMQNLAVSFRAEKTSRYNWQGWIPQLAVQWQQQTFQFEQLQLELGKNHLGVTAAALELAPLTQQLLSLDLLSEPLKEVLRTLAVSGRLENVHLKAFNPVLETAAETPPARFLLQANLQNVALSPWRGAPGASGVSGYLEVAPKYGKLELDSQAFAMQFPLVYSAPLAFDSARGQVSWSLLADRLLVDSGPLRLTADHGPATALLDLDLPLQAGAAEPPQMTLAVGLENTAATYRDKFIPYILNEDFLDWMAGSVPAGHVKEGGFVYRGSLRKGDGDNRTVQLFFDIDNTELVFHPDWPPLSDIRGLVEIDDAKVTVSADQAAMFALKLPSAVVKVEPLAEGGMWLSVQAEAQGSASDALRVVNDSALRDQVGDVFSDWQLQGKADAQVALGIPLAGASGPSDIDVQVQLADSSLTIPDYRLDFSNVQGQLNFSSTQGMSSRGLTAQLYDKPLQVDIAQRDKNTVQIAVDGRIAMRDLERWSQQPALVFTDGEAAVQVQINIDNNPAGGRRSEFSVHSDLQGVAIDLPPPYGKQAERAQPFWLNMPVAATAPLLRMGLTDMAELQLQFNQGVVDSGLLVLDETTNGSHEAQHLLVTGRVKHFDLAQWQPVLERYQQRARQLREADQSTELATGAAAQAETELSVKVRDVQIQTFAGFDQQFEDSVVAVQRQAESWLISARNEQLDGDLLIADDSALPLKATFTRLQLPADMGRQATAPADRQPFKPLQLDFSAEQLTLGEKPLGKLAFKLRSQPEAITVNAIHGQLRGLIIDPDKPLTLEWLRTEQGDQSRLSGPFRVDDLGRVLEQWNYERIIASKQGQVVLDLTWPGSPDQWQLQSSTGPIQVEVRDGRFLRASETAAGTLKVVGIVNFMNIARRLQFDFSDLYKSGISFDKIAGQVRLADAQLNIVDNLEVKSPSSRFYLRGNADLLAKALDMELIATLPVANNLPWIVALAGGLPTAAGVYVASKIFEDQVDRFSSAVYSVTGDWNNPDMQFKRVFDDGKKSKAGKAVEPAAKPSDQPEDKAREVAP